MRLRHEFYAVADNFRRLVGWAKAPGTMVDHATALRGAVPTRLRATLTSGRVGTAPRRSFVCSNIVPGAFAHPAALETKRAAIEAALFQSHHVPATRRRSPLAAAVRPPPPPLRVSGRGGA